MSLIDHRKGHKMDKETRIQIISDIQDIMEKDKEDKEFLTELLMELQEAY